MPTPPEVITKYRIQTLTGSTWIDFAMVTFVDTSGLPLPFSPLTGAIEVALAGVRDWRVQPYRLVVDGTNPPQVVWQIDWLM